MAEPQPYSPDNPAHVRSRKRQSEQDRLREEAAFRWLMADDRGRLVMAAIIDGAELGANPFAGQALHTSYNCGRQAEAQKLVAMLKELCPQEYLQMEAERLRAALDKQKRDEANRLTRED